MTQPPVEPPADDPAGIDPAEVESDVELLLAPREGTPPALTTARELADLVARMAAGSGPVAVDAERASGYRFSQRAYLVQLRRAGAGTALIDPIALPDLSTLNAVLQDAEWVLHAANQDLPCLAEVGLHPVTLFDTELAARLAGYERVGLGAMVESELGLRLEKGFSAADWSTRPLPPDWLTYAALDVEVLVELRDILDRVLREQDKREWAAEEFAALVAAPPAPPRIDPWRRTSGIHTLRSRRQLAAVRELWLARDAIARRRDIAPGRILPDTAIVAAAKADPATPTDLMALKVFSGRSNRRQVDTWFGALSRARALPESALPPTSLATDAPPPANRWSEREPVAAARLAAARAALGALAAELGMPVENLLTPDLVRRLTWAPPVEQSAEAVAAVLTAGGARRWQVALTTPALTDALAATPATPATPAVARPAAMPTPPTDGDTGR